MTIKGSFTTSFRMREERVRVTDKMTESKEDEREDKKGKFRNDRKDTD